MANSNAPYGFQPIKSPAGNVSANSYKATGSAAIYEGSLVTVNSSGLVEKATTSTTSFCGVAASYLAAPGTSTANILVYDDPNQVFSAQSSDTSTSNQTLVGQTHQPVIGSGSSSSKLSADAVGTSDSLSTALVICGLDPSVDNDVSGPYPRVQVKIKAHQFSA